MRLTLMLTLVLVCGGCSDGNGSGTSTSSSSSSGGNSSSAAGISSSAAPECTADAECSAHSSCNGFGYVAGRCSAGVCGLAEPVSCPRVCSAALGCVQCVSDTDCSDGDGGFGTCTNNQCL